MSKKMSDPSTLTGSKNNMMNEFSKWVPLICAGAAVGVSIIALKEIKNVRKELIGIKKETPPQQDNNRLQAMDEQIKKITEYLKNNQSSGKIIKNAFKPIKKSANKIINEPEPEPEVPLNESDEFEEVEVTDSESED